MKKLAMPIFRPKHNLALDKWADIDLFPEKTAKAKAILEKYPVPGHLLKRPSS